MEIEKINTIKMEIIRLDRKSNFTLWQVRMKNILIQHELIDALLYEKKLATMEEKTRERLQMQTVSTICLYLTDEVVIHALGETSPMVLWSILEELYMMKSLTNTLPLEAVLPTTDG